MEEYNVVGIGKRIAKLRDSYGLSQEKLAEAVGITDKHLSKVERGLHIPSSKTMFLISRFFSVDIEYLYTGNMESSINHAVTALMEEGTENDHEAVFAFLRKLTEKKNVE